MGLNINEAQGFFSNWANRFNTRPESSQNLNFFNFVQYASRYNPGKPMENFFQNMENALEGSAYGGGDGIDGNLLDKNKYVQKDNIIYCETKQGGFVRMNVETGEVSEVSKEDVLTDLGVDPKDADEVVFENGEVVVMSIDLFDSNNDDIYKDWTQNGEEVRTEHNEINLSQVSERIELRDKLNEIGKNANLPNIFGNSFNTDLGQMEMKDADGQTVGIFKDNQMATIQSGCAYVTYNDGTDWQVIKVNEENYMNEPFSKFVDSASVEAALAEVGTLGTDPTSGEQYTKVLQFKIENGMVVAYAAKGEAVLPSEGTEETGETTDAADATENETADTIDDARVPTALGDYSYGFVPDCDYVASEKTPNYRTGKITVKDGKSTGSYDFTGDNMKISAYGDKGENDFYLGGQNNNITISNFGSDDTLHFAGKEVDWTIQSQDSTRNGYKIVFYNPVLKTTVTVETDRRDRTEEFIISKASYGE